MNKVTRMDKGRVELLRARRAELAALVERSETRAGYGPVLVEKVNASTGLALSLDDFNQFTPEPALDWPRDLRSAPGLLAVYVDRARAGQVISCLSERLGKLCGCLGFNDADYLGFAHLRDFDVYKMLELASESSESVLFCCDDLGFVLMVDSYGVDPSVQFSVVMQGVDVEQYRGCF